MSSALPCSFTLACPECAEVLTAAHAPRIPTGLSCGHVLCAECADAVTIVSPPVCTVCKVSIEAAGNELPALAAFCDATEVPVAAQAGASTASAASLLAKEKLYRDKAGDAAQASLAYQQKITALQESADAAVETVVAAAAQLKAKLDEVAAARVARIRSCCADGIKRLEIEQDELLVRCSQLGAAAALCASAVASCETQAAGVLASLRTFDTLASKPIPNVQPTVSVRVNDDIVRRVDEEWMTVVFRSSGVCAQGKFVQKYTILTCESEGLAISPDGSQFAVSSCNSHDISIYAVADGAHIRSFGREGVQPGEFKYPRKLVYHPDSGNLLVADSLNERVQEVTPAGEAVRLIGAGVINAQVCGIACNGPLVAVGKADEDKTNVVMLFDYGSGALVRSFGDWGDGVGQLEYCSGMRFTADGRHIVVANGTDDVNERLSQWSVEGVFVKEVGRDALKDVRDIAFAGNGDWIACDYDAQEVVVFSGDDGSEVRRWGGPGDSDGQFMSPIALAQSASGELWVLDADSGRVKVFA